ncbi:MAG: hypothetical protein HFJ45_07600 [Clostridia bacterium]|nr:hypothetical protein [Clostridia bacterium]
MIKNKNGITLIALIITIIVLLILAGISINILLGENSTVKKAKSAKEETIIADYIEKIGLVKAEVEIDYI